eukprot:1137365-Pelagomonas_calceolata.AAC.3
MEHLALAPCKHCASVHTTTFFGILPRQGERVLTTRCGSTVVANMSLGTAAAMLCKDTENSWLWGTQSA